MSNTRSSIILLAAIGAFALGGCGSDADSPSALADTTSTDASSSTDFNDADVAFAQGMIPHHAQAVDMAVLALNPDAHAGEAVKDLATRIQGAQDPEIVLMTGWLEAWGESVATDGMEGMDNMAGGEGMMTDEEMQSLTTLTGDAFDAAWMTMMIRHHEGAIAQSETVKDTGLNPDALALADQIITGQQAEITEMKTLLAG